MTLEPDITVPVITLVGFVDFIAEADQKFIDPGATAGDDRDGDLTAKIVVSGEVDIMTIGIYTLKYDVSDEAGNAAETPPRSEQ